MDKKSISLRKLHKENPSMVRLAERIPNYSEITKLKELLETHNIPFEFIDKSDKFTDRVNRDPDRANDFKSFLICVPRNDKSCVIKIKQEYDKHYEVYAKEPVSLTTEIMDLLQIGGLLYDGRKLGFSSPVYSADETFDRIYKWYKKPDKPQAPSLILKLLHENEIYRIFPQINGSNDSITEEGLVGYLIVDFADVEGKYFFADWHTEKSDYYTPDFKKEFDAFFMRMRRNMLKSRKALIDYCGHLPKAKINKHCPCYGFKYSSENYKYYMRFRLADKDYNIVIYCYRNAVVDDRNN